MVARASRTGQGGAVQEDRVPENENLRAVKARLAEEEARRAERRVKTQRFAGSMNVAGQAAGAVGLGLTAGVLALVAFDSASPLLWIVAAALAVACAVDAWWLWRVGSRGSR